MNSDSTGKRVNNESTTILNNDSPVLLLSELRETPQGKKTAKAVVKVKNFSKGAREKKILHLGIYFVV